MKNFTEEQEELLGRLREADEALAFEWDDAHGILAFARGRLPAANGHPGDPEATVTSFLKTFGPLFGPPDLMRRLRPIPQEKDSLEWSHLQYQQVHTARSPRGKDEELEVYGARLVAHADPDGALRKVQSSCWRQIDLRDEKRVSVKTVREALSRNLARAPGLPRLERTARKEEQVDFPIVQKPRLVVYPWQGRFHLAYATYAYGVFEKEDPKGEATGEKTIDLAQVFVDAATAEVILQAQTSIGAETADTGSGSAVTPLSGPFASRGLDIVRVDGGSSYRLKDTTKAREVVTYDAANSESFDTDDERGAGLNSGTLEVSTDSDGDKVWDITEPSSPTVAQRTASQQPEVDLHFFMSDLYAWYEAIAGTSRAGWDDGKFPDPPVPSQIMRAIAHARDGVDPSSINAGMRRRPYAGKWLYWLQFFDGDRTTFDYLAGSKFIVGHEYQHAITDFSFKDGYNNPGLTYSDWLAAVHEGLSDVFGALYSEQWLPGTDISPIGQIFRNIAFPRDPGPPPATAAWDPAKFDHFEDRNAIMGTFARYHRGDILAHCAYLMGAGGVHRRDSRIPALIPVYSAGRETGSGRSVLRAARIWYRALLFHLGTLETATGVPANEEGVFRTIREGCVSAAEELYGAGSKEMRTTELAFYAVGLQPTTKAYGPDLTFLRWGADWRFSRPYVGVSSPDWSSHDLYVKNGPSASGWNAVINVLDSSGNPTEFENEVYCRVRNVGDQKAKKITVTFEYAKVGTAPVSWQPVIDKNGNVQTLSVGSLAAGQMTFTDAEQESPPASARVMWYLPPLGSGETVDHFCLRATVSSADDVNTYNNDVQSNISYVAYVPAATGFAFTVGNPRDDSIPLDLRIAGSLPKGWRVSVPKAKRIKRLKPGEERVLEAKLKMKEGEDKRLGPPFDGEIDGAVHGGLSGPVTGHLTESSAEDERLHGRVVLAMEHVGTVVGGFDGTLDRETGELAGRVEGSLECCEHGWHNRVCLALSGCLRPTRRVEISQWADGEPLGGLTIQVQVPWPKGSCAKELPPTDVLFEPPEGQAG